MRGRGGSRQGAGRKRRWEHGETQTIRVPVALKEEIIALGQELDRGEGVILGRTCLELENLLREWEAKCETHQGEDWEAVREIIGEIRDILANRPMRGHNRGMGHCHQHLRDGEVHPNGVEFEQL